jgi:HEAT repeat protein
VTRRPNSTLTARGGDPLSRLRSGQAPRDRAAAALALAELDSAEAVAALTVALDDRAAEVRVNAALALASLRDPASIPALARIAAQWLEPELERCRQAALVTLSAFRSEAAAVAVARALVGGRRTTPLSVEDRSILLGVAYADPSGVAAARVVRTLVPLLAGDDDGNGERAAGLLELFPNESRALLVRTLRTDAGAKVRRRAAQALRVCRHDEAVSALLLALTDSAGEVRAAAARSLGDIRDPAAVEPLCIAAADADPRVRDAAQSALAALGAVGTAAGMVAGFAPVDRKRPK